MERKQFFALCLGVAFHSAAFAQNPIIQTQLTGDPAPMVDGDRMYIYAGHDEDGADFFWMNEWRVYSSADMVNWTDHGSPLNLSSFAWADSRAWAAQTIVKAKERVDEKGEVGMITQTIEGFGAPDIEKRDSTVKYKDCYTEGPWFMKRGKNYYMLYAAGGVPEHIAYSMSKKPLGPWKYMGNIMPLEDTGSFTNHCGVVDFKDHSYFVYHTGKLGGGFGRSVAIEEFKYNADGTFPIIHHTREGVSPIGTLNPYQRTEAETIADSKGVKSEWNDETGVYISEIHTDDYIKVREVDFGAAAPRQFTACVASALQGGTLEVHADKQDGELVAALAVPHTGGWEKWQTLSTSILKPITGKHDLYLVFKGNKGGKLFTFDWWKFEK